MAEVDQFLRAMVEHGASDVHLVVGQPPKYVSMGTLHPLKAMRITRSVR